MEIQCLELENSIASKASELAELKESDRILQDQKQQIQNAITSEIKTMEEEIKQYDEDIKSVRKNTENLESMTSNIRRDLANMTNETKKGTLDRAQKEMSTQIL